MPSVNYASRLFCNSTCGPLQVGEQTPLPVFFPCPATALLYCTLKTQLQVKKPNAGLGVVLHGGRGHGHTLLVQTEQLTPAQPVALPLGWLITGEIGKRQVETGEKWSEKARQEFWLLLAISQGWLPGIPVLMACLQALAQCSAETCQAGAGSQECVAAGTPELSCPMVGRWICLRWGSGAARTHLLPLKGSCVGLHSSCSKNCSSSWGEEGKMPVCACCICSGYEQEAYLNAARFP